MFVSVSATGSNCLGNLLLVRKVSVCVVSVSATGSNCLGFITVYDLFKNHMFQYPQPDRIVWAQH